jgi:demethylspheroidene O-methyltransferase
LIRVIHDHDDEAAIAILRAVHDALPPGGTLVVAEPMSGASGTEKMGDVYFAFYLMAMGSGRVRTASELEALLRQAGFVAVRPVRTPVPLLTGIITGQRNV